VESIQVKVQGVEYRITFGRDLPGWMGQALPGGGTATPFVLLLVDENVSELHGDRLHAAFEQLGVEVRGVQVPCGEATKSLEVYGRLCDQVLSLGPDRSTPLISCGGGVTGDAAGFVAATVLRGLPLYQVPTTTLAQADSGVGGKVGLNHPTGKNLLGTFYQPRAVFIDPAFTRTLEDRDFVAGLFEAVKMGLILDQRLHGWLVEHWDRLESRNEKDLVHALKESCRLKARVVELDEREKGPRRVLNFGHTVGHVLEHLSRGGLRHGEAVAWGMAAAAHLSVNGAGLEQEQARAIKSFIYRRVPRRPELPDRDAFLRLLARDKKRRGDAIDVVLLRSVGHTVINQNLAPETMWQAACDVIHEGQS
jgi:3-dehydroquinate synthase